LPKDRRDILRICARTWHGWDYVPQYLNRWLREKGFYVIVERPAKVREDRHEGLSQRRGDGEKVVGLGKFTELSPGELWLEGLRIDPETRSHGLGWQLSSAVIRYARAERPVSIRLATGRRNTHSRRIIRKMGLQLKVSLWNREGQIPKRPGRPAVFHPSPEVAWNYLRHSEEFRMSKGLLGHTWQFRTATPELIVELCRQGRVFGHGREDNLQGLLILQPGRYENGRLDISFLDGARKALPEFQREIRVFARQHKCRFIGGMAAGRRMLRHLGGLRMRSWRRAGKKRTTLIYEYPLSARRSPLSAHRGRLAVGGRR
jgi:GNAT superfamily N-acetyltransferase